MSTSAVARYVLAACQPTSLLTDNQALAVGVYTRPTHKKGRALSIIHLVRCGRSIDTIPVRLGTLTFRFASSKCGC